MSIVVSLTGCTKDSISSSGGGNMAAMQVSVSGDMLATQLPMVGVSSAQMRAARGNIQMPNSLSPEQVQQVIGALFIKGSLVGENIIPDLSMLSGGVPKSTDDSAEENQTRLVGVSTHTLGLSNIQMTIKYARLLQPTMLTKNLTIDQKEGDLTFTLTGKQGEILLTNTFDEPLTLSVDATVTNGNGGDIYLGPGEYIRLVLIKDTSFKTLRLGTPGHDNMREAGLRRENRDTKISSPDGTHMLNMDYGVDVYPGKSYTMNFPGSNGGIKEAELYMIEKQKLSDADLKEFGLEATPTTTLTELVKKLGYDLSTAEGKTAFQNTRSSSAFGDIGDPALRLVDGNALGTTGFSFSVPDHETQYLLRMRDANGFDVFILITATKDFGFVATDSKENLSRNMQARFPFDIGDMKAQLEKILGADAFTINGEETTVSIDYRIPPREKKEGTLKLKNIFGEEQEYKLSLYMDKIPEQFKQLVIQGGGVNILPSKGYRNSKIEIQHKNIPTFTLYYQVCPGLHPFTPDPTTQGGTLESTIISCEGDIIKQEYSFTPERRKTASREIELPKTIANGQMFKVSLDEKMSDAKYFMHTNLGIYTKLANKNELSIWVFSLDEGKQQEDVQLIVYDDQGTQLSSLNRKDTKGVVNLSGYDTNRFLRLEARQGNESTRMLLTREGDGWYSYSDPNKNLRMNRTVLGHVDALELFGSSVSARRDNPDLTKIYGYTDRGMYKMGDTINFAGFVRDLSKLGTNTSSIPAGDVLVTLTDVQGVTVKQQTIKKLDEFGGFTGSFVLPSSGPLGSYYVQYQFNGIQQYSHDIRVEEYQKPSFYIENELIVKDDKVVANFAPTYYFGSPLSAYDMTIGYSVVNDEARCWDCWWATDSEYYYNHIFSQDFTTGSRVIYKNVSQPKIELPLFSLTDLPQRGYKLRIKVDMKVTDHLSDETHQEVAYLDVQPEVKIGLNGQPYDRLDAENLKKYELRGEIAEGENKVDHIEYTRYKKAYGDEVEKGVDGSWYYIQGNAFAELGSGVLDTDDSFKIPTLFSGAGEYFVKVIARDKKGNDAGEVQKRINYYDWSAYEGMYMGRMTNNYILGVNIPRKTYNVGDDVQVAIDPYVKGATVIVTVEKGNTILDRYVQILDGKELSIKVKEGYAPNINISVAEMIGEKISASDKRKEPRLLMGYAQATISEDSLKLKMTIATDKETYQPGEEAVIKIRTVDSNDKPVDARVSVAVVDKALHDLYALIKEPLPYFYNKVGSFVMTYTNMKYLYQALRVFVADGSKGGGGGGDVGLLGALREKFLDVAFWNGAVYTKNGEAEIRVRMPDNLTTRLIDAIAVTKDTKLATTTATVIVNKPLLVQPNLPEFVTLGDKLDIPVNVTVPEQWKDKVKGDVKISAEIEITSGDRRELGSINTKANSKVVLPIELPIDVLNKESITLRVHAKAGDYSDDIKVNIPLRIDGVIQRSFTSSEGKEGMLTLNFTAQQRTTENVFSISTIPVHAFEDVLGYLLHYPYGCTEQLLSSLYPLALAQELQASGLLGTRFIQGDKILLGGMQGRQNRDDAIRAGINQLIPNQNADGGFGYWQEGESEYALSSYTYGVLSLLKNQKIDVPLDVLTRLESYLNKGGTNDAQAYMYYLWNRVRSGQQVNIADVTDLLKTNEKNQAIKVLGFGILALSKQDAQAKELLSQIDIAKYEGAQEAWGYGVYIDKDILKAIMLRAEVALNDQGHARDLVRELLAMRNSEGQRGWSTQKNVQILLALGAYMTDMRPAAKDMDCKVTWNGKEENVHLGSGTRGKEFMQNSENTKKVEVQRSCPSDVLVDLTSRHLPKDLDNVDNELHGLNTLSATASPKDAAIGDNLKIAFSFSPREDAHQVAVEVFIPSTIKLRETLAKKGATQGNGWDMYGSWNTLPFTMQGDWQCYPQHYEVRYDRLFLYYDTLKAGVRCDMSIHALQAYKGESFPGQVRFWEMYGTKVWGNASIEMK